MRIEDAVVVITGASSGIGRATALELAARGAFVVVAARRGEPLEELAHACEKASGKQALARTCDVTQQDEVTELARQAAARLGRIDVWVNNAAVTAFGLFEDTPPEVWQRVMDTNLMGYVHGARAALPYFRAQRSGVLVNNASMVSRLSEPYVSAYVASKHAIRGFSMSLRQELYLQKLWDVKVCVVMPATIDTPFFQHAANFAGRSAKALPPVYPPERVARAIVRMVQKPRREMYVGNNARNLALLSALAPGLTERLIARMTERHHLSKQHNQPPTAGNLFRPMQEGREASGGWKPRGAARVGRALAAGALVAAPALLSWRAVRPRLAALAR